MCKNNFLDDHASLAFIREWIIVVDNRRNPKAITSPNFAFVGVEISNTRYLMAKNKQIEKNLQVSR